MTCARGSLRLAKPDRAPAFHPLSPGLPAGALLLQQALVSFSCLYVGILAGTSEVISNQAGRGAFLIMTENEQP